MIALSYLYVIDPVFSKSKENPGIAAVLVIDSSGSMKHTDPKRLRVPAAKLFTRLLTENDKVGVISFSDRGYKVIRMTHASADNRRQLFRAIDKVSSSGAYTNIHAAISSAYSLLKESDIGDRKQYIVLLSDGQMDTGNKQRDIELSNYSVELARQLSIDGIKVYSIAFTPESAIDLLTEISSESQGIFQLAEKDSDLDKVFTSVFESTKAPDMLPIDGGNIIIDSSVSEITIVASKGNAKSRVALLDPQKRKYTSSRHPSSQSWFETPSYVLITVEKPKSGTWQLISDDEGNRAYVVTNLALKSNIDADTTEVPQHSETVFTLWLEKNSKRVAAPELIAETAFSLDIESPEEVLAQIVLNDDGKNGDKKANDHIFSGQFIFKNTGSFKLIFTAIGSTYQREISRNVYITKAEAVATPEPPPPEIMPETSTTPAPQAESSNPSADDSADSVTAVDTEEEPIEDEEIVPLGQIALLFILVNLFLLVTISVVVVIIRRKSKS